MPLLRFDLIEGRDEKSIKKLLDAAHQAVLKSLGVPERDRYQVVLTSFDFLYQVL